MIPISIFQPSSTAGQMNQSAPTDNGPSQPANRGRVLAFAQKKREAVPTDPKMGTGRGWMTRVRAFNILLGWGAFYRMESCRQKPGAAAYAAAILATASAVVAILSYRPSRDNTSKESRHRIIADDGECTRGESTQIMSNVVTQNMTT